MSTVKTLAKSSVLRIVETIVSIITGFFMMPFLINNLGESDYGLWIVIGSITASLYVFDLGFTEAITRFVGDSLNKKAFDQTNKVISTALLIYSLLAGLILLTTLFIAFFADYFVEKQANLALIQALILITGITLALEFPFKAFAGIAVSYLRHDLLSISRISIKVLSTVVTIILVYNGQGLLTIALIGLAASQLGNWLYFAIAKYLFKEMNVSTKRINKVLFKDILNFSKWTFLIDFSRILKSRMDLFVIAAYLSTSILTTYYVALRLVEYTLQLLLKATNFTTPLFVKYHAEKNTQQIIEKLTIFTRLNLLVVGFTMGYFFLAGESLITLWMGSSFDSKTAYQVLLIALFGRALTFISIPAGTVLIALSKPKIISIIGLFESISSVILIFISVAVFELGVLGAAASLSLPFVLTRIFITPYYSCKNLNTPLTNYYKYLFYPVASIIILTFIWSTVLTGIQISTIHSFLIFTVVYGITAGIALILTLTSSEFNMINVLLPSKLKGVLSPLLLVKKKLMFNRQ